MDYAFVNMGKEEKEVLTILTIRDETSGAIESVAVPEKGPADYAVKAASRAIDSWGLKRVTAVADGEPATQALLAAIKLMRKEETVVTGKPRYDSKSKGIVENANGLVKGLLRTWISSLETHYGVELGAEHSIVHWAVRHCGWSLTRFSISDDGLTPFRKLRGREFGGAVAEFGETVLYHDPTPGSKFAKKWLKGLWLGKMGTTDEHILGTASGRVLARTVARRPEQKRWSGDLLSKVIC
jgi:hypothetical protein